MATVGEAIAATLIAQWSALGGAQPDPIQYLVERPEKDPNPTVADAIYVWLPLRRTFDPIDVAEVYRNVTYTLRIVCHTKTSSARQTEIENEVDRILNSGTVITGATRQRVKEINDISNRSYSNLPKYISEVIMEVFTAMEVSATAYGAASTSAWTAVSALLMYGSENAAWVPCAFRGGLHYDESYLHLGYITNLDANNMLLLFDCLKPTTKGGLKLYVAGTRVGVGDADATNYINNTYVYGNIGTSLTQIDLDTTNRTTVEVHEDTFTAVDASSYELVSIYLPCINTAAGRVDILSVLLKCYYAA